MLDVIPLKGKPCIPFCHKLSITDDKEFSGELVSPYIFNIKDRRKASLK